MRVIDVCPFRPYSEVRPALMIGHGDVTITGFMPCLKEACPAWYKDEKYLPNTGGYTETREHCRRLEG